MVGHAYLSLEQINANGSKVVRNVGFYPEGSVLPGSLQDISTFGADSDTPFGVSLTISVSANEFNVVKSWLLGQQSKLYDPDQFNCVNSVGSALESIDVHLPLNSSGITNLFKGYSPGELGEDLRNLDLNNFSAQNVNRKMVLQQNNGNELTPNARSGSC